MAVVGHEAETGHRFGRTACETERRHVTESQVAKVQADATAGV